MKKILQIYKLGWKLGLLVLFIYIKKAWGLKLSQKEFSYISYFNLLLNNGFTHIEEFNKAFKIKTKEGVALFVRKYPSSDLQVIKQIWNDKEYEIVTELIKENITPGNITVIDAGANVGYSSVFLYYILSDTYKVNLVAIEPATENIAMLEMNFNENKLWHCFIEKTGLYNKNCFLEIVKDFRDGKDWSSQIKEVDYKTSLKAIELNDILKKYNWGSIDFLKIDIEGAERFLFDSPEYACGFLCRTKIIAIEIHHEYNIKELICNTLFTNNFSLIEHGELIIGINRNFIQKK